MSKMLDFYAKLKIKTYGILLNSFSFLNNISLKKRLLVSFVVTSIIPLLILTFLAYSKVKGESITGLIITEAISVLFALIVILGIAISVSDSIKNVSMGLSEIAENEDVDLEKILPITSKDEIGELVLAFNKIQELEKERIVALEDNQKMLLKTQEHLLKSEKMADLGKMVAGIAHEINTPLGVSVTASSYLYNETQVFIENFEKNNMKKSDLVNYLNTAVNTSRLILANIDRASELIKSFKEVAADQSSEEKRLFSVKKYIEEVLISLSPRLKNLKHTFEVNCNEDLQLYSYPGAISQVITNLVMNSIIHAFSDDDKGSITITIVENDGRLLIVYSDDGSGIKEEIIEKIFDPFFTTKRGSGGTGLGLSIVYNIVTQAFGGTIRCFSEDGKGTSFIIDIPI